MTDQDEFVGRYTDWTPYEVPAIAGFLDEDLSDAWSQVQTWDQTHELVFGHRDVLRRTRDSLASAWPPERSPAAQAFFSVLDELIASMDEMQGVAATNGSSLRGILTSLAATKRTVDGLHEQWNATDAVEGAKGDYYDGGFKVDLNQQAWSTMRANDQAMIEYYPYLGTPTPYMPPGQGGVEGPTTPVSDSPDGSSAAGAGSRGRSGTRPPAIPPLQKSGPTGDSPPLLSGAATGPAGGPGDTGTGSPSVPGAPAALGLGGSGPSGGTWFVSTSAGRTLRTGGVIGSTPADADAVVGPGRQGPGIAGTAQEREVSRSVNPGGGVLGGQVSAGAHGVRRERKRSLPPDTEWEVRKGVPPVLLPPPEPTRHDPGPGVIGIDR